MPNELLLDPIIVEDQVSQEKEATGLLTEVFKNGRMVVETNLQEIRERVKNEKA